MAPGERSGSGLFRHKSRATTYNYGLFLGAFALSPPKEHTLFNYNIVVVKRDVRNGIEK